MDLSVVGHIQIGLNWIFRKKIVRLDIRRGCRKVGALGLEVVAGVVTRAGFVLCFGLLIQSALIAEGVHAIVLVADEVSSVGLVLVNNFSLFVELGCPLG